MILSILFCLFVLQAVVTDAGRQSCHPDEFSFLQEKGFCLNTFDLEASCPRNFEISESKDCVNFEGSWCCYNPDQLNAQAVVADAPNKHNDTNPAKISASSTKTNPSGNTKSAVTEVPVKQEEITSASTVTATSVNTTVQITGRPGTTSIFSRKNPGRRAQTAAKLRGTSKAPVTRSKFATMARTTKSFRRVGSVTVKTQLLVKINEQNKHQNVHTEEHGRVPSSNRDDEYNRGHHYNRNEERNPDYSEKRNENYDRGHSRNREEEHDADNRDEKYDRGYSHNSDADSDQDDNDKRSEEHNQDYDDNRYGKYDHSRNRDKKHGQDDSNQRDEERDQGHSYDLQDRYQQHGHRDKDSDRDYSAEHDRRRHGYHEDHDNYDRDEDHDRVRNSYFKKIFHLLSTEQLERSLELTTVPPNHTEVITASPVS